MIALTRMNQVPIVLNADLIEFVEAVPDTVITLTTGQKLMVLDSAEEIVNKVVAFRRSIYSRLFTPLPEMTSSSRSSD